MHHAAFTWMALAVLGLVASFAGCGSNSHTAATTGLPNAGPSSSGAGGAGGGFATSSSTGIAAGGSDAGSSDAASDGDGAVSCEPMQKVCDGKCVGGSDPAYGCTVAGCTPCSNLPNSTSQCKGDNCALGACDPGFKNCDGNDKNGCEVDVGNDPNNCGACGVVCVVPNATASCVNGVCGVGTCNMGWTDCNGVATDGCEANLPNDPMNCGACGKACPGQEECQAGACGLVCPKGTANCPGDPANVCATTLGTNKDCAFCGDACDLANSNSQCNTVGGNEVCSLINCNTGWQNCDMVATNGCETNTTSDPNNCNSCGNLCPSGPHSTPTCSNSVCAIVCDPGYFDCDHDPTNGCEVDGQTNPSDCGGCGTACSMNHATETCSASTCTIVTCTSGYQDCNKMPSDGCEANTQNDPRNCGTCGNICTTANGTPACVQGMCAVGSCNPGFQHCPSQPGTNCETSTNTDVNNCGTCGNVCSSNNDTPSCSGGVCNVQCSPGYGNCNMSVTDGCEASLGTVANCGACGVLCMTQNGTPACDTTQSPPACVVGACSMGYASCPGNGNNCLTYIGGSDANNCGGCGVTCGSDASNPNLHDSGACVGGKCTVGVCDAGWADCNNDPSDGCETPVDTVANCGTCGHSCTTAHGTPECKAGVCAVLSCTAPYLNCPGDGTDCSTNGNTDNNNCHTCGAVCDAATCGGGTDHVASATCTNGVCEVVSCTAGYQDTDQTCSDGCECQLSSVPTSCGAGSYSFGTIVVGGTPVSHTSNLFPATPNYAYYAVTFTGNTNKAYHPKITITSSKGAADLFVMEVTSDCSTAVANCNTTGDLGSANGVTTWEVQYTAGDPSSAFIPIPPVGNNGTVYIKVFRSSTSTGTNANCNDTYTITATNT